MCLTERTTFRRLVLRVALLVSCAATPLVQAASVTLLPDRDATILEEQTFGVLANGGGAYLFAGQTHADDSRRALLSFPVAASIPADAAITSASLTLRMSKTIAGNTDVSLHRLEADWSEGPTDPDREEGSGVPAVAGDVTWSHRVFDTVPWLTQGGDFTLEASATTSVGGTGNYTWTFDQLAADVQDMLDNPGENFGWILIGDESGATTAKRFDSLQNPTAANRPRLVVEFDIVVFGDANCDGVRSAADLVAEVDIIATGERAPCPTDDADRDGDVDAADIDSIVGRLFAAR